MSSFSDLPQELLSDISNRLGLTDLLGFRGVCKNTRSASSNSSAAVESFPWLLRYGGDDGRHCSIFVIGRRYNIHLPEIADSTCVFSLDGWLLFLSPDSSMFFFCPFSRSKINLPTNCPFDLHDFHFAAAFSHSPTHTDCCVVVLRRNSDDSLELCLLRRGDSEWRWYQCYNPISDFKNTMSVIHYEGAFHFLDDNSRVVFFDDKLKESWSMGIILELETNEDDADGVIFNFTKKEMSCSITRLKKKKNWKMCSTPSVKKEGNKNGVIYKCKGVRTIAMKDDCFYWKSKEMKSVLGIEGACCIDICGTLISRTGCVYHLIEHEKYIYGNQDDDRRKVKGVWIQPRFHHISPHQIW